MQRALLLMLSVLLLSGCAETRGTIEVGFPQQEAPRDDSEVDPVPWVFGLVMLALVVGVIAAAAAGAGQRQQQQQQVVVIREPRRD